MSLQAELALRLGPLHLSIDLQATPAEIVAVVGPNGAGKTTLLRALAGLVPIERGRVTLGDLVLDDTDRGIHLAPERRPVAVVFQDYLLFPHLSALDNVAYGLRARGTKRPEAREVAGQWLARVGLAGVGSARPGALSGGQAQRVALARALATGPSLLLLDEPLAAIDAAAKAELRRELRAQLAGSDGVRVLVTHDPVDAMAVGDRLVVLEGGRVTQQGPIAEVTARPRSPWVAALVGLNLYLGTAERGTFTVPAGGSFSVAGEPSELSGAAFALIHPRAVALHRTRPEGSARNVWPGQAGNLDIEGDRVRVQVAGSPPIVAEVTPAAADELRLRDGGPVWVSVKATEVDVYPA
ncbi:MAG TPA: ABC transporter ATP-binding protein [Acidimicrobiales bacterium]|nr:ABC transporter ATP-binding protein [Acidimicrobiales bacterium]